MIICPHCSFSNTEGRTICKSCGKAMGDAPVAVQSDRACPYCAEAIKAAAVVCRFCGREVEPAAPPLWTPPPAPAALTPKPAKSGGVTCVGAIVTGVLAIVLVVGGLLFLRPGGTRTPSSTSSSTKAVYYVLSGTSTSAGITINNADGGTEQRTVKVPYESQHRMRPGSFVYISAQNQTEGTLTCKIVIDGSVFKTSTSEGRHNIASCSGAVP